MLTVLAIYCPLILFVALALAFRGLLPPSILSAAALVGVIPLIADVYRSLRQHRIDLGLPVVVTIFILLALAKLSSALIFVLLILAGRLFKEYILWRVRESVASISKALPDLAFVKRDNEIREIHISAIHRNDTVIVKDGGRVPVDGILITESASLDESVITGESKPIAKKRGDRLVAASISLTDYIELKAADTSANSTIAQMHALVATAQAENAPLSRFTTRYAEATSAVAFVAVLVVYALTKNVEEALALWIALVPVIFAIIVPVATTIGISLLTKSGVLVKTADALENLTKVDTLCFDKTGTLTRGQPEIAAIAPGTFLTEDGLLQIAASVERFSEHHLGEPIVREAERRKLSWLDVKNVQVIKGRGISARVDGEMTQIGNREEIESSGVSVSESDKSLAEKREENGETAIWIAQAGRLLGLIFLADQPRPETKPTLASLRSRGYALVMLTGDHLKVAQKIGTAIGVTEVRASLLPEDKITAIKRLKDSGKRVLMVGDGINDAPALAEANVGVAMGLRGVGITLESAQVVLVHDNFGALPQIFSVAKRTFRIIRLDLVLASSIHLIAAALVLSGVIGIIGSTIFHQVSSVLTLLNTSRLFSR